MRRLLALVTLLAACATDSGTTMRLELRDDPAHAAPACLYRLTVDGRTLHEGHVAQCPRVPVCEAP